MEQYTEGSDKERETKQNIVNFSEDLRISNNPLRSIENIKKVIKKNIGEIEQKRQESVLEIGGWINLSTGQMEFMSEEFLSDYSVTLGTPEHVRKRIQEGYVTFHTHPKGSYSDYSTSDVLAVQYQVQDILVSDGGVFLLSVEKILSLKEIEYILDKINKEIEENPDEQDLIWIGGITKNFKINCEQLNSF